jgi:hypothetical protein
MTDLVRLIYASRSVGAAPNHARGILASARRNNPRNGITGLLLVSTEHYTQALEGPRRAVNDLYRTIVTDTRHVDVTLLHYTSTHLRFWADWSMAYVGISEVRREVEALTGQPADRFDPLAIDSELCERVVVSLHASSGEKPVR